MPMVLQPYQQGNDNIGSLYTSDHLDHNYNSNHNLMQNESIGFSIAIGLTAVVTLSVLIMLCTKRSKDPSFEFQEPHFDSSSPDNVTFKTKTNPDVVVGKDGKSVYEYDADVHEQPAKENKTNMVASDDWTSSVETAAIGGSKNDPPKKARAKSKKDKKDKLTLEDFSGFDEEASTSVDKKNSEAEFGFDEALPSLPPSPKPFPPSSQNNSSSDMPRRAASEEFGFGHPKVEESTDGYSTMPTMPKPRLRASTVATPGKGGATGSNGSSADGRKDDTLPRLPVTEADEEEAGDSTEDELIPAWYAGKMSRKNCDAAVTAADNGDFLIRESSTGDRCVICINDRGSTINLVINVTTDGKYRFAGRERESLHDVVYFLRKQPLLARDKKEVQLSKAANKESALEQQRSEDAATTAEISRAERERKLQFMQRATNAKNGSTPSQSIEDMTGGLVITADGNELYNDVSLMDDMTGFDDEEEEEPLYVDMSDANVPTFDFIAEQEEIERQSNAGRLRLSNEEFGKIRQQARDRAATAALMNRTKCLELLKKKSVRKHWKQLGGPNSTGSLGANESLPLVTTANDEEDFFEYQNASAREFGGYEEEDIYGDTVPRWFAPRLARAKCESIVSAGKNGTYLVRESRDGTKYIICVKHEDVFKNFQIHVRGPAHFEFSGRSYKTLEDVLAHTQKQGIIKNKSKILLQYIADW